MNVIRKKIGPAGICILLGLLGLLTIGGCKSSTEVQDPGRLVAQTTAELLEGAETDEEKLERIYLFVRDEIEFGWVYPQEIPPEEVLINRRGVCMQKANLLAAMAREAGFQARFHYMYVHKTALEDFLPDFAYNSWPDPFPHTFPEVFINGKWISLEATIDQELHEICIRDEVNFGRYKDIVNGADIGFSVEGVKGHQQFCHAEGKDSFYGEDLAEFIEYMDNGIPWYKRMMQPMIFRKSQEIMDGLRSGS